MEEMAEVREIKITKDLKLNHHQLLLTSDGDVNCMDFNGYLLAMGCSNKIIYIFSLKEVEKEVSFFEQYQMKDNHHYSITCLSFSSQGNLLASGSYDGKIIIWKIQGTLEPIMIHSFINCVNLKALHFGPYEDQLCSGGQIDEDSLLTMWYGIGTDSYTVFKKVVMDDYINTTLFSPDGKFVVVGTSEGALYVWDALTISNIVLNVIKNAHDLGVLCCDIKYASSEYGPCTTHILASGGNDDMIKLWGLSYSIDYCSMELLNTLVGHSSSVYCLKFQKDAQYLVSTGNDRKVVIWNPASGNALHSFEAHERSITACYIGKAFLATGSLDKSAMIWKCDNDSLFPEMMRPCDKHFRKGVLHWDVREVALWIEEIGFHDYTKYFVEHEIDGSTLLHLNAENLRDIGIGPLGHCLEILNKAKFILNPSLEHKTAWNEDSIPEEFFCPLSRKVMDDPVVCNDGFSYERSAVEEWLNSSDECLSPITNQKINYFVPNRALALFIKNFF